MNRKYQTYLIAGVTALALLVIMMIYLGRVKGNSDSIPKIKKVYVAMGGGKEGFIRDEEIRQIMAEKYHIQVVSDAWSNNKLIADDVKLVRENRTAYDAVFFSDQRFYDYFKSNNLAKTLEGAIVLNTPVVVYSWDQITDALIEEGIVEIRNNTYFIKDMAGLLRMIQAGQQWSDLGLSNVFGSINIASTDPVTSSPGATYYGLLTAIMSGTIVTEDSVLAVLPDVKEFYEDSGFMNHTPADLFDLYLRTGMGAKPLIVDYEKSMLEFAINNPEGYQQVQSRVRILYPEPTVWNSHCIYTLTENGNRYLEALNDPEIKRIAWEKYGFRTGLMGQDMVADLPVSGVADELTSVVPGLKKEVYDVLIKALEE